MPLPKYSQKYCILHITYSSTNTFTRHQLPVWTTNVGWVWTTKNGPLVGSPNDTPVGTPRVDHLLDHCMAHQLDSQMAHQLDRQMAHQRDRCQTRHPRWITRNGPPRLPVLGTKKWSAGVNSLGRLTRLAHQVFWPVTTTTKYGPQRMVINNF